MLLDIIQNEKWLCRKGNNLFKMYCICVTTGIQRIRRWFVVAKTAVINIRTEEETKKKIENLFSQFGITVSDAVNIFFHQSLM